MERTVFIGPPQSGKTFAAKLFMSHKKKHYCFDCRDLKNKKDVANFLQAKLWGVRNQIDALLIDNVPAKLLADVCEYFFESDIKIDAQSREPFIIKPDIFISSTCEDPAYIPANASFRYRYKVFACSKKVDYGVNLTILDLDSNQPFLY